MVLCAFVCVWGGGGGVGGTVGLVVGTPVYNTLVVVRSISPAVQVFFPSHHSPAYPAEYIPSLYKARVD